MKKLHRYLGLCLSLVMLVVSITGVMLVWKREYLWVTIPAARELPAQESVFAQAATQIQASYRPNEVLFVRFYAEGLSVHKVFLTDRRYAWHDQYGEQIQVWSSNERFEDWLLDLHHRLLLGNTFGLNAVGIMGLLLVPLMLLGLVIWWPWRRSYRWNLVPKSGRAADVRKSHFETGVVVLVPALVIAITGVILVYPTQARWVLRDNFSEPKPPVLKELGDLGLNAPVTWARAFNQAERRFPKAKIHWLSYPSEGSNKFTIGVQEQGSWNQMGSTSLSIKIVDSVPAATVKYQADQGLGSQFLDYSYPLHVGKFPTWYRLILSTVGILLAWLSFLGLIAFYKNRRRKV